MDLSAAQSKYIIGGAVALVAIVAIAWLVMRKKAADDARKATVWAKPAAFADPKPDGSLHKAPNPQRISGSAVVAKSLGDAKSAGGDAAQQEVVDLPAVPAGGPLDHEGIVEQENLLHRYQSGAATDETIEAYYINGAPY